VPVSCYSLATRFCFWCSVEFVVIVHDRLLIDGMIVCAAGVGPAEEER